jgi:hypothetical protein
LLAYAERYLKYPLHDNQCRSGQGGRVASQSLTEASWLIDVAEGALDDPLPGGEVEKGTLCACLDKFVPTPFIAGLERPYRRGDA